MLNALVIDRFERFLKLCLDLQKLINEYGCSPASPSHDTSRNACLTTKRQIGLLLASYAQPTYSPYCKRPLPGFHGGSTELVTAQLRPRQSSDEMS